MTEATMTTDPYTLNIQEAAAVLGISVRRVRDKIKTGLPCVKPARAYQFSREELLAWKAQQRPTLKVAPDDKPPTG